jgi:L-ribulokinase
MPARYSIGFDFGTESVRVVIVDIRDGSVAAEATRQYAHGVIEERLPTGGGRLPPDFALQHPQDWLGDMGSACKAAMKSARLSARQIVGIGVDFTSCTMLPTLADGTPLCLVSGYGREPMAWPKLWKHHGAKAQMRRINDVARERREPWLSRYGGTIGLEWFFPKVLETLNAAPKVYDAAQVWLEAGDWIVWQLTTGPFPRCIAADLPRSTCQAGYKAMWNREGGYPSRDYFAAVHPGLADVVARKMPGRLLAPGQRAGLLTDAAAGPLGLCGGIPVATAIIDGHAGVPGAGVADEGTMVMVLGTSGCQFVLGPDEKLVPGICGIVADGILPGFYGYEAGQASVGDAFAWIARTLGAQHNQMNKLAADLPPGSGGVIALDWLNGCRNPLNDAHLSGALVGLTLATRPEQMYRAMMEATAFGCRWIVELIRQSGLDVRAFVATGGMPDKSPLLMQIYADVLNATIKLAQSEQAVALGAAILGCIAAGHRVTGYATMRQAVGAMARQRKAPIYRPNRKAAAEYSRLYSLYRRLAEGDGTLAQVMRAIQRSGS